MIAKPKVKPQGRLVADGTYEATLADIKTFTNHYGERFGFVFALPDGVEVIRTCSTELKRGGKLAEMVQGLLGRELTVEECCNGVDLEPLKGRKCKVLVLQGMGKNGNMYSNVERVFSSL